MDFFRIFDVFSRREPKSPKKGEALSKTFRNRVLLLCRDRFSNRDDESKQRLFGDLTGQFWEEIHRKLTYLVGEPSLCSQRSEDTVYADALAFLLTCEDELFLDFLEFVFQLDCYSRVVSNDNEMVEEVNLLFLEDDLPYAVTPFAYEKREQVLFNGLLGEVTVRTAFPRVVCRDHQVTYAEAVRPALDLLSDKGMSSANTEFLNALNDYRKGRFGDCLTKCGSAFESVMKIICDRNGWAYSEKDTASTLLKTVIANCQLDNYFEQPLVIIATLRNRLSSSHGAGTQPRSVPAHKARFATNATAAAILLLVEECLP